MRFIRLRMSKVFVSGAKLKGVSKYSVIKINNIFLQYIYKSKSIPKHPS